MFKKSLALLLALTVAVVCLASCGLLGGGKEPTAEELMADAEAKLESDPYTATVSNKMTAKDPSLEERIGALGETTMTVVSTEDGFKVRLNATLGDVRVLKSYTAVGGTLYLEYLLTVGEESAAVKEKASLKDDELADALAALGAGAEIGYEDFTTLELAKTDDGYTVTCSEASDEAIAGAEKALTSSLGENIELELKGIDYVATVNGDGALQKTVLTYTFAVILDGIIYNMTSEVTTSYDYSKEVSVAAPEDADMYTDVAYGDLIR